METGLVTNVVAAATGGALSATTVIGIVAGVVIIGVAIVVFLKKNSKK